MFVKLNIFDYVIIKYEFRFLLLLFIGCFFIIKFFGEVNLIVISNLGIILIKV